MDFYYLKENGDIAQVYIFGDIVQSDLAPRISSIEANKIEVYINSYGGEVAEGLAIYHALKNHSAEITTICTGFACSSASVIFMAGDIRKMLASTILMIHNAWTIAIGDHKELNKQAEVLEKMTNGIKAIYEDKSDLSDDELTGMMNEDCYLNPAEALEKGLATEIEVIERCENNIKSQITNKITEKAKNSIEEESQSKAHFMSFFNFN